MDSLTFVAEQLARNIERDIHEMGWDQPAGLWDIHAHDLPEEAVTAMREYGRWHPPDAEMTIRNEPGEDPLPGLDSFAMAFSLHPASILEGHPYDAIHGLRADEEALGVVMVVEGWDYPVEVRDAIAAGAPIPDFPPSEHPQRREIRLANVVWRDGSAVTVQRYRDSDEVNVFTSDSDGLVMGGRVPSALRCYLGVPSAMEVDLSARQAGRQAWLHNVLRLIRRFGELPEDDRDQLRSSLAAIPDVPEELADNFVNRYGDALAMMALNIDPADTLRDTPGPGGFLATIFEGASPPGYQRPLPLAADNPPAGSKEDLELWERVRLSELRTIDFMLDHLEQHMAETGKRSVAGIPGPLARGGLETKRQRVVWQDAALYAAELEGHIPDEEWLRARLDELLEENVVHQRTAHALLVAAGLEPADA